jgi:hypothetical protein
MLPSMRWRPIFTAPRSPRIRILPESDPDPPISEPPTVILARSASVLIEPVKPLGPPTILPTMDTAPMRAAASRPLAKPVPPMSEPPMLTDAS